MDDAGIILLFALVALGFAVGGHRAWRKGRRKAVLATLFGVLAAGSAAWLAASWLWTDGPAPLVNGLLLTGTVLFLGPGLGLLAASAAGLMHRPAARRGGTE